MSDLRIQRPGGGQFRVPLIPVDQVGAEERASFFTKRSIKKQSKLEALYLAVQMMDLTTLEGSDTAGKVRHLCAKAVHPVTDELALSLLKGEGGAGKQVADGFRSVPSVAAVCVYSKMVPIAVEALQGTGVSVASVATAFPAGQVPLSVKLQDVRDAVRHGATEIDMVIDRGAFLSGQYQKVFDEVVAVKEICGTKAHLKVILETGELVTYDKVRLASWLAMEAGADFIKTSTGKAAVNATLPVTLVMLQAIADYFDETNRMVGMKPAGGIRTAKQAIHYLCMLREVLGRQWLNPDFFRFGASTLLNDVLRQIFKEYSGRYYYKQVFSLE